MTAVSALAAAGDGPPLAPPLVRPAADRIGSALRDRMILVLEDEVFIAAELREALEAAGARVAYARTLRKALRLIDETRLDGAILDVTLGSGLTCEPAAAALRRRGTPFVLHSGDLMRQGEVIATIDAPLIPKPSAAEDVIAGLARALPPAAPADA